MYKRKSKTQALHPVSTSQGISSSLNISKYKLQDKTISAPVTAQSKITDDDDYIPEAAPLSKRVRRNSSVDKENLPAKKYFEEILEKCGLQIQYGSSPHTLTILGKEPIIIANELQTLFKKSNKSNEMIEKFMKTFEEYCKNEKYLKKALLPTQVASSSDTDIIVGIPKDSLIRILLNVDFLQEKIIDFVLEKLMEYALEEDDESNWTRLFTRPLAFLPTVNNSHKLATSLLDLIEVAAVDSQMELITILPDILPDHEHEFVSIRLSELMKKSSELIPAILECYGHLTLNTEKHNEVRKHLLALIQTSIAVTHIPILTQYLLNTCPQSEMVEVIQELRKTLIDTTLLLNTQDEKQLSLIMTFSTIQLAFMKSKPLANAWIKVILNIKEPAAHRSTDVMILIILYTIATHKKNVENIFKKKITSGLFKIILIEHLYNTFLKNEIFKEYINSVIDIAAILMRMKGGQILSDFASKLFVLTFTHQDANIHNQQDVIHSLILLTGGVFKGNVKSSLKVLTTLAEEHTKLLQQHSLLLLNLLNDIDELDFFDIKCIMDILCRLAFSSEYANVSTLEDDLHILIQKQLNSSKRDIQYKGIIGAVMAAKHLAAINSNDEDLLHSSEKSTISISDIPNEQVQQAAKLMSNVIRCTSGNVEAIGFAYDHLASMLVTSLQLNSNFLAWLADTITNDFQKYFIVEDIPDFLHLDGINFEMSHCINEEHEQDSKFAVNIGGLCLNNNSRVSVLYLSSLFRLMRLVHYRQNNNLTAIDAVLGCSIIMPQVHLDVGGIQDYDPKTLRVILNCYFNCINWFREVISAFVSQKFPDLQVKVILRLKGLIKLEEEFTKLMCYAPTDYKPPPSYFPSRIGTDDTFTISKRETAKTKSKGGKKNDETTLNNTNMSLPPKSQTNAPSTSKIEVIDQGLIRRNYFRDLDVDILIVLRNELSVPTLTEENTLNDEDPPISTTLKLTELRFILEDLVVKLQEILSDPAVKSKNNPMTFTTLQLVKPSDFITDCIRLFPYLTKHCHKIIECMQEILKSTDGIRDAPLLYAEGTINVKVCFSLIIEVYALTLSWSDLQHPRYNELLRDGLRNLLDEEHRGLKSIGPIITEISSQLLKYTEYCLYISAGINLVKLMRTILNFTSEKVVRKRLVQLSENLLSMSWTDLKGNSDCGAQYNIKVDTLVKTYLLYSDIDSIQSVISWVQEECLLLKGKADKLHTFPSISKLNFPLLYRGLCAALVSVCRDSVDNSSNHLTLWRKIVLALQSLMSIVKIQDSRSNLAAFLRRSLEILKMFLSKGITILEIKMKSQPETVVEIFRIMQQSTRFLHSLCCHSKVKSDGGLMGFVPAVRSTLEALIYRVKAALIANDCSAAFWMGNLRNKDIYGEEILSQTTQDSTANTDEDGDQLPEDDDESDAEVQLEGEEKIHSSSEVF